mmetsp:Transcript_23348/g.44554  ORF Transcript_23348/g.44554 Transcript_23348/m.44554 type:complete len:208 (-) Transcript_23348:2-625(-)
MLREHCVHQRGLRDELPQAHHCRESCSGAVRRAPVQPGGNSYHPRTRARGLRRPAGRAPGLVRIHGRLLRGDARALHHQRRLHRAPAGPPGVAGQRAVPGADGALPVRVGGQRDGDGGVRGGRDRGSAAGRCALRRQTALHLHEPRGAPFSNKFVPSSPAESAHLEQHSRLEARFGCDVYRNCHCCSRGVIDHVWPAYVEVHQHEAL